MKLYCLLTTFRSDAASAHWRRSLVSDKHVPVCRFQSVSPGAGALVWFSCSQWKVNSAYYCDVLLLKQLLPDILSSCWLLLLSSPPRVRKALSYCDTRLRTSHQSVASQQTRPQFCRLQDMDGHSGRRLSETRDVKHHWWTVVINRMPYYISQGGVETPIRRGVQFCGSFVANLLQYLPKIIKIQRGSTKSLQR